MPVGRTRQAATALCLAAVAIGLVRTIAGGAAAGWGHGPLHHAVTAVAHLRLPRRAHPHPGTWYRHTALLLRRLAALAHSFFPFGGGHALPRG
jgi:hypothetical protein